MALKYEEKLKILRQFELNLKRGSKLRKMRPIWKNFGL